MLMVMLNHCLYAPVNEILRNEYRIILRYEHLHVLENLVVAAVTLLPP